MIVITDIKYIEFKGDVYTHLRYAKDAYIKPISTSGELCREVEYTSELLKGKRFVNEQCNIDITMAISSEVSRIIGLPFEVIDNLQLENAELHNRVISLRAEVDRFNKNKMRKLLDILLTKVGL